VSSVLALTRGSDSFGIAGGGETMLLTDLQQIRVELVGLLERLASQLPTSKERKVFIINNVDQVSLPPFSSILISLSLSLSPCVLPLSLSLLLHLVSRQMLQVFQERRVMSEEVQKLEDMLMQQRELFAEEALKDIFPRLVSFVIQVATDTSLIFPLPLASSPSTHQTEQALATSASTERFHLDEALVESLVREFASSWRTGIQQINDDVLKYFANFRNGMEILKQVPSPSTTSAPFLRCVLMCRVCCVVVLLCVRC
jgi:vacuolar protein sorting-associated protein 52